MAKKTVWVMIKLILNGGDYPRLSEWALSVITGVLVTVGRFHSEEGSVNTEAYSLQKERVLPAP